MNATTYEHAWTRAQAERTRVARYFIARRFARRAEDFVARSRWHRVADRLFHEMPEIERGVVRARARV